MKVIATRIIGLLGSLYAGTECTVRYDGGLLSFPISSGVRQGASAPTLFNTCTNWILDIFTVQINCGEIQGNIKVIDLYFADDGP